MEGLGDILRGIAEYKEEQIKPRQIREILPMERWLDSEYYVGPSGMRLYPYWKEALNKVFNSTGDTKITEVIVTGGEYIRAGAFYGCVNIKSVTLPDGVKHIGYYAFQGCTSLEYIRIPDSVTIIYDSAFQDCVSLQEVILPANLITISPSAFKGCIELSSITIPVNVTFIAGAAFSGCVNLTTIYLERPSSAGITALGINVFLGCNAISDIFVPDNASEAVYRGAAGWLIFGTKIKAIV